ncbi:hypothetical protein CLV75_4444 [Ruegeria conchae]|uniref:Uncharacterized protein n=1 Tax=Ruegeria conchae TaxID=981384 RepID=A0A497Z1Z6_9RHOB|nr:hypothetical protein CLV75_4444 [Ruegeria conchae]
MASKRPKPEALSAQALKITCALWWKSDARELRSLLMLTDKHL